MSEQQATKRGWLARLMFGAGSGAQAGRQSTPANADLATVCDPFASQGSLTGISGAQLKQIPLFRGCSESALEKMAAGFKCESFPAGTRVIQKGDVADKFYILARGEALVSEMRSKSDKLYLAKLSPPDCMGEIALLRGTNRTADVETIAPCVFMTLERREFLEAVDALPELRAAVEKIIDERLSADERAELLRDLSEV